MRKERKTLVAGIMPLNDYIARTVAIAKGEDIPKKGGPKVFFESVQTMAQVLSSENRELLRIIQDRHPKSIKELEAATGRKSSNLSRTLKTMAKYGIVDLVKQEDRTIRPVVKKTNFRVEFSI
jgi:predicted transcriptional regulator